MNASKNTDANVSFYRRATRGGYKNKRFQGQKIRLKPRGRAQHAVEAPSQPTTRPACGVVHDGAALFERATMRTEREVTLTRTPFVDRQSAGRSPRRRLRCQVAFNGKVSFQKGVHLSPSSLISECAVVRTTRGTPAQKDVGLGKDADL